MAHSLTRTEKLNADKFTFKFGGDNFNIKIIKHRFDLTDEIMINRNPVFNSFKIEPSDFN